MKTYGYVRISDANQQIDRQMIEMKKMNIPIGRIYVDKISGRDFERPAFKTLMKKIKKGDQLYIHQLDRLGRNYEEIQAYWKILTKDMGIDIVVIDMPLLDTRLNKDLLGTFIADLVLQIMAFCGANELEMIKKRQAEGIHAAKIRGVRFGRPRIDKPDNFIEIVDEWERQKLKFADVLVQTGLKQTTFYHLLRELRENK